MSKLDLNENQLRKIGAGNFFRPQIIEELGITYRDLQQLVEDGIVERVARGLYRLVDAEPSEHYSIAAVCARAPQAIVCLLSALSVHELGTQLPHKVWIAIPHKARVPRMPKFKTRVVRFSGPALRYGIEQTSFEGVPARITSLARTVVDCFRFRRIVGMEVALEALREAFLERRASVDEIWRAAEVCRARTLIGPYMETLAL